MSPFVLFRSVLNPTETVSPQFICPFQPQPFPVFRCSCHFGDRAIVFVLFLHKDPSSSHCKVCCGSGKRVNPQTNDFVIPFVHYDRVGVGGGQSGSSTLSMPQHVTTTSLGLTNNK